jgi:REP element-mobilizing transposase RayT
MAIQLYTHLSWTTVDRRPMIGVKELEFLRRFLPARVSQHGVKILAMGAVSDHVHLILTLPGEFNVPKMVQALKGASARIANRDPEVSTTGLRWERGYDLRSTAIQYVNNQASRHPDSAIST